MARKLFTVKELADSVRSRIDELNRDTIDDERDILPALNRALEYAVDVYARRYPDPYVTYADISLVDGDVDYEMPEDAYEDRVLKIDLMYNSLFYYDLKRVSYRDLAPYETTTSSTNPYYYAIVGRNIRVTPTPSGTSSLRVWYVKNPEPLVLPQGRITVVGSGVGASNNYVVVDSIGSQLSTENDELANYVNIINARTGQVRGTFQILSIDEDRITFRSSSPTRTEIFGQPVLVGSDNVTTVSTRQDDYICLASGTCVPFLSAPTSNFLIQFSVAELSRQLGLNSAEEEQVLAKFEKQISSTWSGRENTIRVQKRSSIYGTTYRAWPLTQKDNGNG